MRNDLGIFFFSIFLLCFFVGRLFRFKEHFSAEKYGFGIKWVYLLIAAASTAVFYISKS